MSVPNESLTLVKPDILNLQTADKLERRLTLFDEALRSIIPL